MVRTRSRATSPGHQESRDASSHPQRNHQSALVMPQSSVQHMHSMAASMAELMRRNQELIKEINSKKQHNEGLYNGINLISLRISGLDNLASVRLPTVVEGLQGRKQSKRRPEMTGQTPSDEKVSMEFQMSWRFLF